MKRPRIKVEPTTTDHIFEGTGALFLILMLGSVWYYYGDLPADIPIHFNAAGDPDAYDQKSSVLFLPVITLVVCLGMFFLNRYPHLFNYPLKITPDNAKRNIFQGMSCGAKLCN